MNFIIGSILSWSPSSLIPLPWLAPAALSATLENTNKIYFSLRYTEKHLLRSHKFRTKQIYKWVCKLNNLTVCFTRKWNKSPPTYIRRQITKWARLHQIWKENSTTKYVQIFFSKIESPLFMVGERPVNGSNTKHSPVACAHWLPTAGLISLISPPAVDCVRTQDSVPRDRGDVTLSWHCPHSPPQHLLRLTLWRESRL